MYKKASATFGTGEQAMFVVESDVTAKSEGHRSGVARCCAVLQGGCLERRCRRQEELTIQRHY
ncbi:MAG TPA: hypothetical protein VGN34_06605 [Ktedonobacteraceae bacterium]